MRMICLPISTKPWQSPHKQNRFLKDEPLKSGSIYPGSFHHLAGLIYGFGWGDFWEDGGALMDNPWGIVSLVDVYVGFFLFLGWVWIREDVLPNCSGRGDSSGRKSLCLPLCTICPWA